MKETKKAVASGEDSIQLAELEQKEVLFVEWLGQHMIQEVPSRTLTRKEYVEFREKIIEAENSLQAKIYKVVYEGEA